MLREMKYVIIVFTTTLTKLVGTIAASIANGDTLGLKDVKIQSAVVVSYLFGCWKGTIERHARSRRT
jgi:hypothetical protein